MIEAVMGELTGSLLTYPLFLFRGVVGIDFA